MFILQDFIIVERWGNFKIVREEVSICKTYKKFVQTVRSTTTKSSVAVAFNKSLIPTQITNLDIINVSQIPP